MLKMETGNFLIQFFKVGLDGGKFLFHLFICSCTGDNHKYFLFREIGRKTKMKRVLEKENFELGKTRVGNWSLTRFWTLSKGQGSKKCEFQKRGERMVKFFKEGKGIVNGKQTQW